MIFCPPAFAQDKTPHLEHAGILEPGTVGLRQLFRGGPLPGYFQPVELKAPEGCQISLAIENHFTQPLAAPLKTGLLIAPVYRFKITNIPRSPGAEIYPTVELINRLYPPRGQEFRFPVPIEFTLEELELALSGKFVTRIVYVENPQAALPHTIKEQSYFEIRPGDDPLEVADRLGRPIAIVRIGGRLPDDKTGPDARFLYGSPAMMLPNEVVRQLYPDKAAPTIAAPSAKAPAPQPPRFDPDSAARPARRTAQRVAAVQIDSP